MAMTAFSNTPHGKKKKKIPHCDEDQADTWGPISMEGTAARSCSAEPVAAATTGVFYPLAVFPI